MKIVIKKPNNCNEQELDDFYELVNSGGQVNSNTLLTKIKESKLLAFGYNDSILVSVSCLKIPYLSYKERIFKKASLEDFTDLYLFELGYCVTHEKFRGNGYNFEINQKLISKIHSCQIFSSTANPGMIHQLIKLGFTSIGNKYVGNYNSCLQIYSLTVT